MRRRSGLMAVSVMRCSCLNGGWQSPILRQDAAGLEAARILSPSKARALESKAAPEPGAFYRVSGFVQWHFSVVSFRQSASIRGIVTVDLLQPRINESPPSACVWFMEGDTVRTALLLLLCVSLAGCVTAEERMRAQMA